MNSLPLAALTARHGDGGPHPRADLNDCLAAHDLLATLFDTHHRRLYRLACRLASTTDDALDLVQETFLKAARTPKSIPQGFVDQEAWLVRILVNTRRDQWRKAGVRTRFAAECRPTDVGSPDAEAALIARTAIWSALDALSPRRRAVVVLHELEGLTVKEVSSLLGINAITVRWHLSKGRRDLANILKPVIGAMK